MIASLSHQRVLTIFYNLRKTVFRAIHGISIPPNEFHNCRTEEEVYQLIKTHNKAKIFRSQSMVENMFTQSTNSSRLNWASQSAEAF
jgi:hypothetical protein